MPHFRFFLCMHEMNLLDEEGVSLVIVMLMQCSVEVLFPSSKTFLCAGVQLFDCLLSY